MSLHPHQTWVLFTSCTSYFLLFRAGWAAGSLLVIPQGEKTPSQSTPLLVSHVDRACVESSCPAMPQGVPVASKNDSIHLEMNGRDRCPLHPWYCLSQFSSVSSGLDCYSHTWNLEIQSGLGWWGWFGFLSRWQHEIRDVTRAGTAEVTLQRGSAP